MRDDPDEALMLRVGAGDRAACRIMVDRHLAPVTALARRMLGNPADAEDVAQEVFLRVWTAAHKWRPGPAKVTTWLYRVTMNLCLDRLRKRPELPLEDVAEPPDPRPDAAAGIAREEVARRVAAALAALPERQRAAITLCHHQGLGNIEAAAVLGISVEALESLLARGRRALRERLRAEAPDLLGRD